MKTPEDRQKIVFYFSAGAAALSIIITLVLVIAQSYIRFKINRDFTFLGGFSLETFIAATFALLAYVSFLHREK